MLSTHLTSEERRQLLALATELDGLPYVEKAERLRARMRELRSPRRHGMPARSGMAGRRSSERRAA